MEIKIKKGGKMKWIMGMLFLFGLIIGLCVGGLFIPIFVPKTIIEVENNITKEVEINVEKIVLVNITNTERIILPCPEVIKEEDDKKSGWSIHGGWAQNNTWWNAMDCSPGYNCTQVR